jgi:hypothetical protein
MGHGAFPDENNKKTDTDVKSPWGGDLGATGSPRALGQDGHERRLLISGQPGFQMNLAGVNTGFLVETAANFHKLPTNKP